MAQLWTAFPGRCFPCAGVGATWIFQSALLKHRWNAHTPTTTVRESL